MLSPNMLVLFIASVTLMVQAAQNCTDSGRCEDETAFAVAVGAISTSFLLLFILYQRIGSTDAIKQPLAAFLALWWFAGACVFTFDKPYKYTGNGYFASWGGAIASLLWACECFKTLQANTNRALDPMASPVAGVAVCSLVELISAALVCDEQHTCEDEAGWAVACGAVSLSVSLIALLLSSQGAKFNSTISAFLVVWWVPGVYIMTFTHYVGNFASTTGNGFFACWGALVCSAAFFMAHWFPGAMDAMDTGLPTIDPKTQNSAVGKPTGEP